MALVHPDGAALEMHAPTPLFEVWKHAIERDRAMPLGHRLWKALRWGAQRVTAPVYLADCDAVGEGARTRGRPVVENAGRIELGARPNLSSIFAPVELATGAEGVLAVGDDVAMNFGVRISAVRRVKLGDRVALGPYVTIDDGDGEPSPITIGDDVWLATRVRVLPGAVIGNGAVITAGSVVSGEIPPNVVAGGVPARVLRLRGADAALAPTPAAKDHAAPATTPARRGLLIADFSIQELARHLRSRDVLGPVLDAEIAPFDQVVPTLHALGGLVADKHLEFAVIWVRPEGIGAFRRLRLGEAVPLSEILAEVDALAALLREAAKIAPARAGGELRPRARRARARDDRSPAGWPRARRAADERASRRRAPARVQRLRARRAALDRAGGRGAVDAKLWYLGKVRFSPRGARRGGARLQAALRGAARPGAKSSSSSTSTTPSGAASWATSAGRGSASAATTRVGEAFVDFQRAAQGPHAARRRARHREQERRVRRARGHREAPGDGPAHGGLRGLADQLARQGRRTSPSSRSELNLGLQSVVFIDDNPVERARVREALPEVLVPDWPDDKLRYPEALRALRCFDAPAHQQRGPRAHPALRRRARARGAQARGGLARRVAAGLGTRVRFEPLGAANVARAAQLLNKTNQINLRTRRLSEAELLRLGGRARPRALGGLGLGSLRRRGPHRAPRPRARGRGAARRRLRPELPRMGRASRRRWPRSRWRARGAGGARARRGGLPRDRKNKPCLAFWERSGFICDAATATYRLDVGAPYPAPPMIALEGVTADGGEPHG